MAKSRGAVTINKAQLKKMVPAADRPAFLDTVDKYQRYIKANTKNTRNTKNAKKTKKTKKTKKK